MGKLKEGASWEELAKKNDLTPETTDFFSRNDYVPQIGYALDLQEAAFGLGENKRYPDDVFEYDKGVFVIRWNEHKGIDEKEYQEEKEK